MCKTPFLSLVRKSIFYSINLFYFFLGGGGSCKKNISDPMKENQKTNPCR